MVSGSWVLEALTARASWLGGHGHSRGPTERQREWRPDPNKQGRHRLSGLGEMGVRLHEGAREGRRLTRCQSRSRAKSRGQRDVLNESAHWQLLCFLSRPSTIFGCASVTGCRCWRRTAVTSSIATTYALNLIYHWEA